MLLKSLCSCFLHKQYSSFKPQIKSFHSTNAFLTTVVSYFLWIRALCYDSTIPLFGVVVHVLLVSLNRDTNSRLLKNLAPYLYKDPEYVLMSEIGRSALLSNWLIMGSCLSSLKPVAIMQKLHRRQNDLFCQLNGAIFPHCVNPFQLPSTLQKLLNRLSMSSEFRRAALLPGPN